VSLNGGQAHRPAQTRLELISSSPRSAPDCHDRATEVALVDLAYRAALHTTAGIRTTSLLDYLR
jgi:hypothetical protein